MATDWFFPGNKAIVISLFKSTFYQSVWFTIGINTYFIIAGQSWRYPTKLIVIYIFTFLFYFCNSRSGKIGFHLFVHFLDNIQLFFLQWSAGIAIFATAPFTFAQIADKLFFYHIVADQYIINYYHKNNFRQRYKLLI